MKWNMSAEISPVNLANRIVSEKCFWRWNGAQGGGGKLTERKHNGHLNDRTTQHSAGQKLAATFNQWWSALPVTMDLFHGLFADRQSDEHG